MRVSTRRGRLRLYLTTDEAALLRELFGQLEALLEEPAGADDPVLRRLFPDAYRDDDQAALAFHELTASDLRADREDRIGRCTTDLADADGDGVELTDADDARRWLQAVNDLRLALGTRLGITADFDPDVDPDDPGAQPVLVYQWLTWLQDSLVTAVSG